MITFALSTALLHKVIILFDANRTTYLLNTLTIHGKIKLLTPIKNQSIQKKSIKCFFLISNKIQSSKISKLFTSIMFV